MSLLGILRRVDKGSLAGWFQQLCTASSALLLIPIFVRYLGDVQSGLWLTFQSLVAIAGLADFGISYVAARQAAYALGRENGKGFAGAGDLDDALTGTLGVNETLRLARLANLASCLVGLLVLAVSIRLAHVDAGAGITRSEVDFVLYLLGLTVLVRLFGRPFASILDGSGFLHFTRLVGGGQQVFMSVGAAVIVFLGYGLAAVSVWALVTALFEYGLLRSIYLKQLGVVPSLRFRAVDYAPLVKMLKVAYPLGLVSLGGYLVNSVQLPFIAATLGPAMVTPYYVAQRIGQFINMAILQLILPKLPQFTRRLGSGDQVEAGRFMRSSCRQVLILSILGGSFFLVMLPFVSIHYFKVTPLPFSAIMVMSVDLVLLNSTVALGHYVLAAGKNPFWKWTLISGLLNFSMLYFGLRPLGIIAIPLATLMSGFFTTYWASVHHGYRTLTKLESEVVW